MAEIEAELAEVRFAWNGRTDGSGSIYYRIQGPTLLIEFSTRGSLGAAGGHAEAAEQKGGDAVVGVSVDYEAFSHGEMTLMRMVTATGTTVSTD